MNINWTEISSPAVLEVQPRVSAKMITYNHGPFIAQAIQGVVMQKTTFPIELIIGVDRSTDDTLEVALDFQKRYPNIIRVFFPDSRVGVRENSRKTFEACRGKYIAICEGDDFWIDPGKLAKQVDVLEKDPSLAGSYHDCYRLNQGTGDRRLIYGSRKIATRRDTASIIQAKDIPGCSVLFRNCISISELAELAQDVVAVDHMLCLLVSEHGAWYFLPEPMAVYRVHGGGIWSNLATVEMRRQQLQFIDVLAAGNRYPDLRPLILSVKRNQHRCLGIALAEENHFLKSLYHYTHSIGPNGTLRDTRVRSSEYWLALARGASNRVGLHAPLAWMWRRLARPRANP